MSQYAVTHSSKMLVPKMAPASGSTAIVMFPLIAKVFPKVLWVSTREKT